MKSIKKIHIILCLLSFALFLLSIDVLIQNIKYNSKINKLEKEIKEIKMDYQFLKYNTEQLEEYKNGE